MTKKVLKKYRIPKYSNGTEAAAAQPFIQPLAVTEHKALMMSDALKQEYGITGAKSSAKSGIGSGWGGAIGAAGTAVGKYAMNALGVEENSQAGQTFGTSMEMAEFGGSIVPGWGHLIGGVVGLGMGALKKGSVDEYGNITYGGIWGRSKRSLQQESNRKKNSLLAQEQTANMLAEFANNNPNVEPQPAALAAEGGIMRRPVDALVSKGELIYDPTTKELRKIPGDKGKTNKKDDVPVKLYEGDIVLSNSPTMLMSNGLPPAKNLEMLVDKKDKVSEGTKKAREAIIKKVVNWLEANKTKPQLYAMYDEGTPYVEGQRAIKRHGRWWWNEGGKKDAIGNLYYVPYNGTEKPTKESVNDEPMFIGQTRFGRNDILKGTKVGEIGSDYKLFGENALQPVRNLWGKTNTTETKSVAPSKTKKASASVTAKQANKTASKAPDKTVTPIKLSKEILDETTPGSIPTLYDHVVNSELPRVYGKPKDTPDKTKTTKWAKIDDLAYPLASVLTPLLDREKADPVRYQVPVVKYVPTGVNVDPQLRAIDDSHSIARYNQLNINPNTGAGMAYGLQSATNRAKQMADVYAWQQNAQNELIGRNVDTYNQWSRDYSNIMNDVYDKTAANVAAARNINRQNRATALNNWGQIRRDNKAYKMDKLRLQMAEPMLQYVYENYNDHSNWKKENGYG